MCRSLMICAVSLLALSGCDAGGTTIAILFAPPAPIPRGERGDAQVTLRFRGAGNSWAGRKVKLTAQAPADVKVEPAESEVTLDRNGDAVVKLSIQPSADAPPGPRKVTLTAIGSETASTSLEVTVTIK